ncbi:hypothetical protein LSM04_009625 [Trypanosoma melophagium]|uniref:uncharacterized protein n=1 Tax=Trypanosoma melophagium TaxID=715481 RepID=UPI00351A24DD|nr:hypothetical protein LSM04_009625 [Trypanosoma melophagium]
MPRESIATLRCHTRASWPTPSPIAKAPFLQMRLFNCAPAFLFGGIANWAEEFATFNLDSKWAIPFANPVLARRPGAAFIL